VHFVGASVDPTNAHNVSILGITAPQMLCTATGVIPRLPSQSPEEPCRGRRPHSGHRCLPEEVRRWRTADGL